jgi:hypothetical protein
LAVGVGVVLVSTLAVNFAYAARDEGNTEEDFLRETRQNLVDFLFQVTESFSPARTQRWARFWTPSWGQ